MSRSNLVVLLLVLSEAIYFEGKEMADAVKYAKRGYAIAKDSVTSDDMYVRKVVDQSCLRFASIVVNASNATSNWLEVRNWSVVVIEHFMKYSDEEDAHLGRRFQILVSVLERLGRFSEEDVTLFEIWIRNLIRRIQRIKASTVQRMDKALDDLKMLKRYEDAVRLLARLCTRICTLPLPEDSEFLMVIISKSPLLASPDMDLSRQECSDSYSNFEVFQSGLVSEIRGQNLGLCETSKFYVHRCALASLNKDMEKACFLATSLDPTALLEEKFDLELESIPYRKQFTYGYKFADENSGTIIPFRGTLVEFFERICSPIAFFPVCSQFLSRDLVEIVKIDPACIDFSQGYRIGRGAQGDVYLAKLDGEEVAVKKFSPHLDKNFKGFRRELKSMQRLKHANVVSVKGHYESPNECGIVFEYCETTLAKLVEAHNLDSWDKMELLYQIALALSYLHSYSILHRDLKPDNILVQGGKVCKVADFGMAKEEMEDPNYSSVVGSAGARPPEYFSNSSFKGHKAGDVYAFAMIIYFILHKKIAFKGDYKVGEKVEAGIRPEIDREVEDNEPYLVELMKRCWRQDWAARPTFSQIAHELYCQVHLDRFAIDKISRALEDEEREELDLALVKPQDAPVEQNIAHNSSHRQQSTDSPAPMGIFLAESTSNQKLQYHNCWDAKQK